VPDIAIFVAFPALESSIAIGGFDKLPAHTANAA
jgi:hypothetical protein